MGCGLQDRALPPPTYTQPSCEQALVHATGGQGSLRRMTRFRVQRGELSVAG